MKELNSALRKIRDSVGYSQEIMGMLMDIHQSTYNKIENGKQNLKMEHIPKIAKAVNKTTEEIINSLYGVTVQNSINDNAQNNQNIVNTTDRELINMLLAEKDRVIGLLAEQNQLLKSEIERMKETIV